MQTHSGVGVKIFKLRTYPCYNPPSYYVDRWLQIAISLGIEEVELKMNQISQTVYKFACSLLFSEKGSSIRSLFFVDCAFRYTVEVGPLSNLTSVHLRSVYITGEELCCFFLKELSLSNCNDIVFLEIPCLLSQLNFLQVQLCKNVADCCIQCSKIILFLLYGETNTHLISPHLNHWSIYLFPQTVNTPIIPGKFTHLKHLEIVLYTPSHSQDFDFYSLVSLLMLLQTFVMRVEVPTIMHDSMIEGSGGDSFHPRRLANIDKCLPMTGAAIMEAGNASLAIIRHIEGRVPSTVNLKVIEPCSKCHRLGNGYCCII
uniref:At1g61320/AtMIF1 LRR domain-containing protein n=1 Tax=Oryza punctata TaxID=4537 RepID=A0A0E0LMS6_ORYPU